MSSELFFERWYIDKKLLSEDDQYTIYSYHHKDYDEEEDEIFWETKGLLKVEKRDDDVTHYFIKKEIDRPQYRIREKGMTYEQELQIRSWCGTKRKPKHTSEYIGFEKGLAIFKSFLTDKVNGKIYHVLPDGDILEMLNDDKSKEDIQQVIDILLDTDNVDKIKLLGNKLKLLD